MTAVIVHIGKDAVSVFSDTAVTSLKGKLANLASKVFPIPHANLVIACRGSVFDLPRSCRELQRVGDSFDTIRENAEKALKTRFRLPNNCEVYCAGISEKRGPAAWMARIGWHGRIIGIEDIDGEDAMFGPFANAEIVDEFERRCAASGGDREANFEWLIDVARAHQAPVFGLGKPRVQVGGHAVLTKITAGAIESRILKTWPDKIGERISLGPA